MQSAATITCPSTTAASAIVASLNYADETRATAQNFPSEGAKRYDATVVDARGRSFTLLNDGFELISDPAALCSDWRSNPRDQELLKQSWYAEVEDLVQGLTGAAKVSALNHVYRSSASPNSHELTVHEADREKGGKECGAVLNGVDGIHTDFAPTSRYILQLQNKLKKDYEDGRRAAGDFNFVKKRFTVKVVNVWQSISEYGPIQRKPLCLAHPDSIQASELRENYKEMNGNTLYNLACTPESTHEWYYFSEMEVGEMLVFYGYDAAKPVFHTAFEIPNTPASAPTRESLETRLLCVFEFEEDDSDVASSARL